MEIRKKITLQFVIIVALIYLLTITAIYISFSETRKEEFYDRLSSKAKSIAQMLVDIDEIDKEVLRKIEQNNPLSLPNEKVNIYDKLNRSLFSSEMEESDHYSVELLNIVRISNEVRFRFKKEEIVGYYHKGQNDKIVVFVAAEDIFGMKKLKRLGLILIIVYVSGMLVVFLAGRIFARNALKPLANLIDEVDHIKPSQIGIQLNEGNGTDEISKLSQTFNRFLRRLESVYNMQKNFINNASHELRTPLTVLSGQLEVMLLKERKNEEYKRIIESTLEELKKLSEFSNQLLLLAQASSDFSDLNFSHCRVDDLLWQSRQELIKRKSNYSIEISFSEEIDSENKLLVFGNSMLLKTAFLNLMDNGCKYSPSNTVRINISSELEKYVVIEFADKGIGISDADLKHIYQPFYRAKDVLQTQGHGIGLSLVDKIVKLHKGEIKIDSQVNTGTTITICFPLIV
ncbi:HAMP domain-containing sensor histidine kinase [Plebeiibacterium sediminum]|uniref:histidine kinase n=1 Tax=Plebeiibacterium sediminum TaxID=2992112 RepID=A0AAE3M772_9BACT|nr:HAMP domain-containing sensor histidine kinase [Plebeiobacterium sediminum]MCW3788187.1 HAMP domain-containing histidine kinase [Plebeiobacterium sediminum]